MKKILSVLLAVLLIAAMLPMGALAASLKTVYVSSTGSGSLNLRTGPGKNWSVKGYVYHGDQVEQLSTSGEWSKVEVQSTGKVGWIKTKYFDGTTKALGTGTKTVDVASGTNLNLRTGPGTSYAVKGKVADGATVKVLNTEDDWVKVTDSSTGKTGWIMAKYIGASSGSSSSGGISFEPATQNVGRVSSATLNLRTGPGTSYAKVATLEFGDAFKITGSSGNWYEVNTFDGKTGWLSKNYVTDGAPASVTASSLNLRKGAGSSTAWLRSMPWGTYVKVNSITGSWANITVDGVTGYASVNYLHIY